MQLFMAKVLKHTHSYTQKHWNTLNVLNGKTCSRGVQKIAIVAGKAGECQSPMDEFLRRLQDYNSYFQDSKLQHNTVSFHFNNLKIYLKKFKNQ